MVNRLYNKQVSPKGYFLGGRVKKKKKETENRLPKKKALKVIKLLIFNYSVITAKLSFRNFEKGRQLMLTFG